MNVNDWHVVGIDPAPSKNAVLCHGDGQFESVPPPELRKRMEELATRHAQLLVAWDAPLSFDKTDFYDRKIDKAVRRWAADRVREDVLADKAVNVRSFAGLPHWTISCHAVGYPFGDPPGGIHLVDYPREGRCVVEVHPAVALAVWWVHRKPGFPLMRYKGNHDAAEKIAETLGFPGEAGSDDDHLDAYAAFKLGIMLLEGSARFVGSLAGGGYVLPDLSPCRQIEDILA